MTTSPSLDELYHEYGAKAAAVEPGGVEPIPLEDRHGKPSQMFWTWVSPNMEFATIFVGIIAVLFFGLTFWQAVGAIVLGTALGAVSHGILTSWGPERGLAQMVLGRRPFGYRGNLLPAGLNAIVAGVGWFAVNSISGALALSAFTGWNGYVCLVVGAILMLVVAFLGHNFVHLFERVAFPVLVVVFVAGMFVILPATQTGPVGEAVPGGFWIALGATFGYTAGWNPYAADYARYLPPSAAKRAGLFAGLGNFLGCVVLETAGAAAVTAVGLTNWNGDNPTGSYISLMPAWLGGVTLLAIFVGAISANALNLYSAAMSFVALGVRLPTAFARAAIALAMGVAGLVVAVIALRHVEAYEGFLLVIAYWIGPWLGVVFADRLLDKTRDDLTTFTSTRHVNLAGPIAMAVAMVVSIFLFSNQTLYVGVVAAAVPSIGDIAFEVGFVLAFALYAVLRPVLARRSATVRRAERAGVPPGASAA
jgi:nucleobase:cation symporter-1, NCS1 family